MFESINFGYEPSMDPGASTTEDNGPSFWPSEEKLPNFKANVGQYYSAIMGLSRQLLHLFALSLNLEETFFDKFCKKPGVLLKLNHYPAAVSDTSDNAGIHAHSDLESKHTLHMSNTLRNIKLTVTRLHHSPSRRRQIARSTFQRRALDPGGSDTWHLRREYRRCDEYVDERLVP